MRREEYEEAKQKNPDWDKVISADIKSWSKLYIFDSILTKREYKAIIEKIDERIESFVSLIDEKEIADKYRADLHDYAEQEYQWAFEHFGMFTPHLLALAIAGKKEITKAQIKVVEDRAQFVVKFENVTDVRIPQKITGYSYTQGTPGQMFYEDINRLSKKALDEWIELEPKPQYFANVNPRNLAEMLVRFETYKRKKQELIDKGVRLVLVPAHANCSKRCQPWQGRVYSLDGTSGTMDGRRYIPIEDASDNVTYTSKNTGKTYYCGLFSYNCRHDLVEYKRGMNIERIPAEVIEERRKIEMRQREMERNIRLVKERAATYRVLWHRAGKDEYIRKLAYKYELKARQMKKEYIAYSKENKIAYYPTRLRTMEGENIYIRTKGKNDPLAKRAQELKEQAQ
jgi:hypothetical protein